MGYRTLDQIIIYDHLLEGSDPTYELDEPQDIWYLGLAGELASEIKCSKITLPMLSREKWNWENELRKALIQAVSIRPHKHVDNFNHALLEFSKEMSDAGLSEADQQIHCWLANSETRKSLTSHIDFKNYKLGHYEVDRRGLVIPIPNKIIALTPASEYFGCLSINERFFNFFILPKNMFVYYLKEIKIDANA